MTVDPDTFRSILGRFASGVTVVTVADPTRGDFGITVTAFASLSLSPPLVLVCIDHQASIHPVMRTASHFVVNVLAAEQETIARRFSAPDDEQRFQGLGYSRSATGAAVLDDVLAYLECRKTLATEGGDHTIFTGTVEAAENRTGRPLLYYRGGYAQLER